MAGNTSNSPDCPISDLNNSEFVNDILASWKRSKEANIATNRKTEFQRAPEDVLNELFAKNRRLIVLANSVFKQLNEIIDDSGHILLVYGKDGIILSSDDKAVKKYFSIDTWAGVYSNEEKVGTTAHALCIKLNKPIQVVGSEHYCQIWNNIISTAAPICDAANHPIAALALCQIVPEGESVERIKSGNKYMIGFIAMTAQLLSSMMQLEALEDKLEVANEFVDYGALIVDQSGHIISANGSVGDLCNDQCNPSEKQHLSQFLDTDSALMKDICQDQVQQVSKRYSFAFDHTTYYIWAKKMPSLDGAYSDEPATYLLSVAKQNHTSRSSRIREFDFDDIIGQSNGIKRVIQQAKRFSVSSENILIMGESGTGKELFAQAIHNYSRYEKPFVVVNCASLPQNLAESELFGYESGAFTGAEKRGRAGKIELANGGTLFLDEIGDMPLTMQASILRTMQDKKVMRIGSSNYSKIDFRLIAATNKDLSAMVKNGQFREDLYYRLSVLSLQIPPLRKRKDDIELLCQYIIRTYCENMGWKELSLAETTLKWLIQYDWPGNVRQLKNALIFAINNTDKNVIGMGDFSSELIEAADVSLVENIISDAIEQHLYLEEVEKRVIEATLRFTDYNYAETAKVLGINRSTLYRKVKIYDIAAESKSVLE